MRWLTFLLCSVFLLTLQSTVAPRVELLGARPDWLLVMVVFYAMHARMPDAAVGAWVLGACADLMTIERPGLMAASYLLAALPLAAVREYFFRYRGVTQFGVTLATCLAVRMVWCGYRWALYGPGRSIPVDILIDCLLTSLYTAAWAPLLHKILLSMSGFLGINRPRYSYAGLERMKDARV